MLFFPYDPWKCLKRRNTTNACYVTTHWHLPSPTSVTTVLNPSPMLAHEFVDFSYFVNLTKWVLNSQGCVYSTSLKKKNCQSFESHSRRRCWHAGSALLQGDPSPTPQQSRCAERALRGTKARKRENGELTDANNYFLFCCWQLQALEERVESTKTNWIHHQFSSPPPASPPPGKENPIVSPRGTHCWWKSNNFTNCKAVHRLQCGWWWNLKYQTLCQEGRCQSVRG